MRNESRCKPCARARRIAERNPEREAKTCKVWRENNREHHLALLRRYGQSEQGKAVKAAHQRARKARMRSGQGDTIEIRAIYAQAMREEALIQHCPLFALPELGRKLHVDHIHPLSRGGRHEIGNLQILVIGLNMRKGAKCPK